MGRRVRSGVAVLGAALAMLTWAGRATALDEDAARTVAEGRLPAARACLTSAAEGTHGGVTLTVTLGAGGSVRQVDVTLRGPHVPSEVARCMATALRAATFGDGEPGTMLVVRFVIAEPGASGERVRLRDVSLAGSGAGYGS